MKPDQVITNPGAGASANAEYLTAVREEAIETPEPVLVAETLLEHRRFELVQRMTAQRFVKLSHTEKRNYRRWAKHFSRVFAEKHSLFERHSPADIDTPTYLQARG